MANMYNTIKELCDERGITGGKLCSECGISRGNLTDLKNGRIQSLSIENIQKVASYFGVSMERIVTGEDDHLERLLDKQRTLLHRFGKLSEKDEQIMLDLLDRLEEGNAN